MNIKRTIKIIALGLIILNLTACYDVEEGYRIDYAESSAEFAVTPTKLTRGSVGDTVIFEIKAKSNFDIKSIIVRSTTTGKEGTGFQIKPPATDPLIDHTYGTIKRETRELDLVYRYIVSQDSLAVTTSFCLIDDEGKKMAEHKILTVPSIVRYNDIKLYTNTASKTDGFSSAEGVVYNNLPNYEAVTAANQSVQESIDVIFLVSNNSAMLVAPYNGNFSTNFSIKNKTKFKKMESMTAADFAGLTNASLSQFIDTDNVNSGSTLVSDVKVGDFIGFKTDFASKNSYKYGIMRINAMHPANASWYEGMSYVVKFDVVTQIKK